MTNNRESTPSDPLFPVHQADIFNDCESCEGCTGNGDPCVDCDWGTHGVDPEDVVTTGVTNGDETWCTTTPNGQFFSYVENASYCSWTWQGNNINSGVLFSVIYAKVNGVGMGTGAGCTGTIDAGEWGVALFVDDLLDPTATSEWEEKTTGFCCDPVTKKINGTHTFTAGPCDGTACGGTPTVTVPLT